MGRAKDILEQYKNVKKVEEESKEKAIIKELIDTGWSGDNNSQMKAVQLLKGLATSDSPEANAFMKKLDSLTSGMKVEETKKVSESMSDKAKSSLKKMSDDLLKLNKSEKSDGIEDVRNAIGQAIKE